MIANMHNESPPDLAAYGRFDQNIIYFARTLRGAGMRVGPAAIVDAVKAVETGGISSREDFYWTLHCVLVSRHEDHPIFDETFKLFWQSRGLLEKTLQMFSPTARHDNPVEERRAGQSRVAQSMFPDRQNKETEKPQIEIDAKLSASERELLMSKDFAQMTVEELAMTRRFMQELVLPIDKVRTRRFEPTPHQIDIDPRRTLAASMKSGGDIILPKFRKHKTVHPPLVVLADISGSMGPYTRVFLQFLHALSEKRRVHTFLFGTRLTNVTRQLRMKDPDEALDQCADAVEDWSGGTRIGSTIREFNRLWSRRVLSQGAVVLLISDGLERDGEDILDYEMARLQRSCRRLIWLNPLLRFDGFEARAHGIRTMLRHVDEFRPVHSLNALEELCEALSKPAGRANDPKLWLSAVAA